MTPLERLAQASRQAKALLDINISYERARGRTLESIAKEVGMTKAGVRYICRKMDEQHKRSD